MNLFMITFLIAVLGLCFAIFNYVKVVKLDEGTAEMSEIAKSIRIGANTFLKNE